MTRSAIERLSAGAPAFTAGAARKAGLSPRELYGLREAGEILEISRGVYRFADAPPTAHLSLIAVSHRIPRGIICATSALAYWDLTDELPAEVHIAVPRGVRPPTVRSPATRVHVFAAKTFAVGKTQAPVSPLENVPIYSPARTVVDLMRLRNRLGRDIAFDALKRYLSTRDANPGELLRLARKLRVETPMAAALEVLVA